MNAGGIVVETRVVVDDQTALESTFLDCIPKADIIISTGGVSMGSHDFVKPTIEKICGSVHFGRLRMKPGKPTTFGTIMRADNNETLIFGLPGNPVSALSCFHLLVVPAIEKMSGKIHEDSPFNVALAHDVNLDPERVEYMRASLAWKENSLVAISTGLQVSSRLMSMRNANVMVEIPSGHGSLPAGTLLPAQFITNSTSHPISRYESIEQSGASHSSCACCVVESKKEKCIIRIGVLICSDRCFRKQSQDKILPIAEVFCKNHNWDLSVSAIVPDEFLEIQDVIKRWTGDDGPNLILTCGGTGFSPRDCTPEAVGSLLEKQAFGIQFAMMQASSQKTPFAILSRPIAGVRNKSLILTLPGNPKAFTEIMTPLAEILPHAVQLLEGGVVH